MPNQTNQNKERMIADAIYFLANEIKFLGFGGADRDPKGIGALEGLAMKIDDSNTEIANAISETASAIRDLAQAVSELEK